MAEAHLSAWIGRRVSLPGHFDAPVVLEDVRPLGADGAAGYECRVRLPDGALEEAVVSSEEAAAIASAVAAAAASAVRAAGEGTDDVPAASPADPEKLRLLIESARIRLACAYDRQFAVSLSGIRTLPRRIEAVYRKMLPQPRLRFLLADDPGAGKTIGRPAHQGAQAPRGGRALPDPRSGAVDHPVAGRAAALLQRAVPDRPLRERPATASEPVGAGGAGRLLHRLRQAGRRPGAGVAAALGPRHHRRGPHAVPTPSAPPAAATRSSAPNATNSPNGSRNVATTSCS